VVIAAGIFLFGHGFSATFPQKWDLDLLQRIAAHTLYRECSDFTHWT